MKKIVLLTLSFVSALSFCSCNKNYDKLIVGEWELDKNAFYELIDDDTCYSEIFRNSNNIFICTFFDDGNIRIGNVDTNELDKYLLLFRFPYDSLLLRCWNVLDSKELYDDDPLLRLQIIYTIHSDSISLSIDSVRIIDKFRVVKLNKGKLILEGYDKNNNLRHFEFNKVGFSWVSYVFDLIGVIVCLLLLVGYIIFRIGGMALHYWRNPIYQYGEVNENAEDEEEDTEELLAIKQALKPNVMDFIESERGREELSSMGDGIWQDIRESRTRYRKHYKSDDDLFIKKDEDNDDMSIENMYRLPNGLIPFDGGVIVLPPIYEFIRSKGGRGKLRAWLCSDEGIEWQKSANGIVWVRDVVFYINYCKFTIWGGNNMGSFWYNIRRRLKDMFGSIWFWVTIILCSIISLAINMLTGEKYNFMKGLDYMLLLIIIITIILALFPILDYLIGILIKFNAIKRGEHFMKRSTIYYKDFAKRVNETNKRDKVYQREK